MVLSFLLLLVFLAILAALYGMASQSVLRRFGTRGLIIFLPVSSVFLAGIGVLRTAKLQRAFAYRPSIDHPWWMLGVFAAFLCLFLLPVTVRMVVWHRRGVHRSRLTLAYNVLPWALLGFCLALLVFLVLDLAGVQALPPSRGR